MKKIILLGYMGSGKSTIAKLLHNSTAIPLADTDEIIAKQAQMDIPEIFAVKGEIYFRKLEHTLLNELLDSNEQLIISLGGGTPCYYNNHLSLQRDAVTSIYLKASIATLYDRIKHNPNDRPMIAGKSTSEAKEFIAKHLFDRSFYYNHAKFKIATDNKSPEEILTVIENILI